MDKDAIVEIAEYRNDVVASLRLYFGKIHPSFTSTKYLGFPPAEVLAARIEETDQRSIFVILTVLEAAFRVDYQRRCERRMKDDLSRDLREINKIRGEGARLDEDIFQTWKKRSQPPIPQLVGELRGAFKLRHWFAHGRYWTPKLGRKYDFNFVYSLVDDVFNTFQFCSLD